MVGWTRPSAPIATVWARCQAIGLPLVEARAHSNLVEVLAGQGDIDAARRHWEAGLALSRQAGFDDEITYYQELAGQFPALNTAHPPASKVAPPPADAQESPVDGDLATIVITWPVAKAG